MLVLKIENAVFSPSFIQHLHFSNCMITFRAFEIQVDSIEYYKEKVDEYTVLCDAEKVSAYENKIGFAFVTFENEQMAFRYE